MPGYLALPHTGARSWGPVSLWASLTKHHRLMSSYTFISHIPQTANSKIKVPADAESDKSVLVRRGAALFSLRSHREGGSSLCGGLTTNLILQGSTLLITSYRPPLPPHRVSTYKSGENANIESMASFSPPGSLTRTCPVPDTFSTLYFRRQVRNGTLSTTTCVSPEGRCGLPRVRFHGLSAQVEPSGAFFFFFLAPRWCLRVPKQGKGSSLTQPVLTLHSCVCRHSSVERGHEPPSSHGPRSPEHWLERAA